MDIARLETDEHGDLRSISQEPRRRLLPRRRKDPARWTDEEVREAVQVAYVPGSSRLNATAVVLHIPERVVARRLVRTQRNIHGPWLPYIWWGFAWDATTWEYVQMGDAPFDLVQAYAPHAVETDARQEARHWVEGEAGAPVKDVSYFDMPEPARAGLLYAITRGQGHFFG